MIVIMSVSIYRHNQSELDKAKVSMAEVDVISKAISEEQRDFEQAYTFIVDHLPHGIEDGEVQVYENTDNQIDISQIREEIIAQLLTSIRDRDLNKFFGLFSAEETMLYVNQFTSYEEMERSTNSLLDKIDRESALQGIGIDEKTTYTKYPIYFLYEGNEKVKVTLTFGETKDMSTGDSSEIITTPIQEIAKKFE